ncbi:hypothetical protein BDF14DRAFT_1802438 [Spinellus fusiger]|nr:hypothetical protein BDF14DRAFT_1802438 [Spinellus fusiger]
MVKLTLISIFALAASLASAHPNKWNITFVSPTSETVWITDKTIVEWRVPDGTKFPKKIHTFLELLHVHPENPEDTDVWSLVSDFDINKGSILASLPLLPNGEANYTLLLLVDDYHGGITTIESEQFTIKTLQN